MSKLEGGGVNKLTTIRKNNPQDSEECCTQMFQYWLNTAKDASWNTLVDAVKSLELIVFAEELEKVLLYNYLESYVLKIKSMFVRYSKIYILITLFPGHNHLIRT